MDQKFVVVEPDPIVLMDLVATLQHSFPGGSVTSLAMASEIRQLLDQMVSATCFFINGGLLSELVADDVRSIIDTGSKIVSIGRSTSDMVPATVLEIPFTMDMIIDALSTTGAPDLRVHQPEAQT